MMMIVCRNFFVLVLICLLQGGCKKSGGGTSGPADGGSDTTEIIQAPVDPAVAATMGFFLDDWQAKSFVVPSFADGTSPSGVVTDSLFVDVSKVVTKVPLSIYGNNSNLWMGQIVTQPSLMGYIADLAPHIIRAPAGSVSDVYFWNGTQSAPADAPGSLVDASGNVSAAGYWFGGNTGSWTLALDNYYALLSQTNSKGILTVNYGYARYGTSVDPVATAAHLAADWVRYDKGRTRYWEVGNESYGNWEAGYRINTSLNKDGQPELITGDLYGRHFKVFADSMHAAAKEVGVTIYVGATLVESTPYQGAYTSLVTWNDGVLTQAGSAADFFIVHNYFTAYNTNSTAAEILASAATVPANVRSFVLQALAQHGVGVKPIAFTEWNIQAVGAKQDVSNVAGVHAAKALGALIKAQFGEASRWDLANGWDNGNDMGMFNMGDEPGAVLWNPRPAFFYLYYFQRCFGDRMVSDSLGIGASGDLTTWSSSFTSGEAGTVIVNSGTTARVVSVTFRNFAAGATFFWYSLAGGSDNGDFSGQVFVNGVGPSGATGGPLGYGGVQAWAGTVRGGAVKVEVPARGVVYVVVGK